MASESWNKGNNGATQELRIFFDDPVLPDNGVDGHNWRDDFQLTLHKQDEVTITRPTGATTDFKVGLDMIVRDIDERVNGGRMPALQAERGRGFYRITE